MVRLIRYLRVTLTFPLILSVYSINIVKLWVYGSFGVHSNTRSQTGSTASLGKGYFISTSITQKLNTRSSTETELVAADDLMPHLCWTNYFLNNQGYDINSTVMYKTTSRLSYSKITVGHQAQDGPNISTLGIFS